MVVRTEIDMVVRTRTQTGAMKSKTTTMTGKVTKTKKKKKTKRTARLAPDVLKRLDPLEDPVKTPTEPSPQPMERDVSPISDPDLSRKLVEADLTGGNRFWPSVVFGAREEVGLRLVNDGT